jgi:poly(3-hydroxybutyrate) depolymerase
LINYFEYWNDILDLKEQTWSLPNKITEETDIAILRQFKQGTTEEIRLITPPMAGHHSNISEKIIKMYCEETDDSVYGIEWKSATQKTKNYGLQEIVNELKNFIEKISNPVHLSGLCQGGYTNVIYSCLYPENIKSIIIAGTPIDFVVDGGKIQNGLTLVPDEYYQITINLYNGIWPGMEQLMGFKMLNPYDRFVGTYFDLWKCHQKGNNKGKEKWIRNNSWYEHVQDLPGKFIMDVIFKLFKNNELINKKLIINDKIVDLTNIKCPVVAITGDNDDITLERQCTNIFNFISSKNTKHYHIDNCGHIGIFLKNEAIEKWKYSMEFISEVI